MADSNYYNETVLPAMESERVEQKLKQNEQLCTHYMKGRCTKEPCLFAHGYEELYIPADYVPYEKNVKGFIDAKFPRTAPGMILTVSFNQCYPTLLTEACLHGLDAKRIVGRVCEHFLLEGGCPHWRNCRFIHVDNDHVNTITRSVLTSGIGEDPLGPVHAHNVSELIPPVSFESTKWSCKTKTIQVWIGNQSEEVDTSFICLTEGLLHDHPKEFCKNPECTRWRKCKYVHLKRAFWDRKGQAIFPKPAYFNKKKQK